MDETLYTYYARFRGGSRLVGVGLSRSHMSFYLRTGGGGGWDDTCRYTYIRVNISRLLILQSLH